jgi:hypothetical protein
LIHSFSREIDCQQTSAVIVCNLRG